MVVFSPGGADNIELTTNIKNEEGNGSPSPSCKKELCFFTTDDLPSSHAKNLSMFLTKDVVVPASDIKNIPLLEDDEIIKPEGENEDVEETKSSEGVLPCPKIKFTKLKTAFEKVKVSFNGKTDNEVALHEEMPDDVKEFAQVRRKKLRSEMSDQELWEGFPVDLKLPRLKSKTIKKQNSFTGDCNKEFVCKDLKEITASGIEGVDQTIESESFCSMLETDVLHKVTTPTKRGVKVLTRLKAKTPEKFGLNSVR